MIGIALELVVGLHLLDQLEAADVRHLDVHDDEIGREGAGAVAPPRGRRAPARPR